MSPTMSLPKFLRSYSRRKLVLLLFLLALLLAGALPRYLRGNWSNTDLPQTDSLPRLRFIAEAGVTLSNWETAYQQRISLGSGEWLFQEMQAVDRDKLGDFPADFYLMLRPQTANDLQPQVEWTDIKLFIKNLHLPPDRVEETPLTIDSYRQLEFSIPGEGEGDATATARFFRAWTPFQTYAVVEWYAWPEGGHYSIDRWFWAERRARLAGDRVPWAAVAIFIPIEPLGEIEEVEPFARFLAKKVHIALQSKSWQK